MPAVPLQAATKLSGGAKKAPKHAVTRQVSKSVAPQPVKKGQVVRLQADSKEQVASHKVKPAQKQVKNRKQPSKAVQVAKKSRSQKAVRTAQVRSASTTRTVARASVQPAAGTPFLKKKATLDEQTRLANTLQDQLGVEVLVQENRAHSGGLFIAPPSAESGADNAAKALDLLANLPLGTPLKNASISSSFGGRQDPINGRRAFHEGVDFRAKTGEKVFATGKGQVVSSSYSPDYGENIIISHGKGYESMFAHLSKRLVQVGDSITPGDLVGLVGNSGRSTGAHLHYEIRYLGAPINPMDYMRATQQARLQKK